MSETKKDDGGPAFPGEKDTRFGQPNDCNEGMSLRDYLAGKAMQGMVGSISSESEYQRLRGHAVREGMTVSQWIARESFKQSDAMLAERKRGAR